MRKVLPPLLLVAITLHLLLGVWWLAALFGIILLGVWLGTSQHRFAKRFRGNKWVAYTCLMFSVLALGVTLQTLFFGIYFIPSNSMERTLQQGDRVWVSKLSYGPRLPKSPYDIPWFNVVYWLANNDDIDNFEPWNLPRLKGYGKPKRNQVVVFDPPHGSTPFIKRCIALPGDTLQIVSGTVLVNGVPINEPFGVLHNYNISLKKDANPVAFFGYLAVNNLYSHSIDSNLTIALTREEELRVAAHSDVLHLNAVHIAANRDQSIFPLNRRGQWSVDFYGPFVIPYKGMQITLDSLNVLTYGKIIELYEGEISVQGNGENLFTFENNYYFMMGDNRHGSNDSRHFGPIPESSIVGRATLILYSKSNSNRSFSRSLKRI
jgi:signal peptidase I